LEIMSGWSSSDDEAVQSRAARPRSRSRSRDGAASASASHVASASVVPAAVVPQIARDYSVADSILWWASPILDGVEEIRLQRLEQGLKDKLTHVSLCTGMATELLAFEAFVDRKSQAVQ
jgi:hypothetical protein